MGVEVTRMSRHPASTADLGLLAVDRASPLPLYCQIRQQLVGVIEARRRAGLHDLLHR
jgi:hypothetical protein